MNRSLVVAEWQRARQSLRAAEVLTREGFYEDALSRTYYAALHAAKAALHVQDVTAESHAGVRRMFGLRMIRSGEIEPEWSPYFAVSLDNRLAADYDAEISASEKEARKSCGQTRQFLKRIHRYLLDKGFTESELRRKSFNA